MASHCLHFGSGIHRTLLIAGAVKLKYYKPSIGRTSFDFTDI